MQNTNGVNAAGHAGSPAQKAKAKTVIPAQKTKVRSLVITALMGVLSFILMYFQFSVPIISPFAEFDASALPEIIGGFILGPVGAVEIIVLKLVLKLIFKGTNSMFTGEILNLLLSIAYVLPAIMYYRKHRTRNGAVIGLVLGTLIGVAASVVGNLYVTFPMYMYLYGMTWEQIIGIFHEINPSITNIPTVAAFSVVPFNLISRRATSAITMLVYKKISIPIKKFIS